MTLPTSVSEVLSAVPDTVVPEKRRLRLSTLLGLAVATQIPVPSVPVGGGLMDYFNANAAAYRNVIVGFNEATPFSIDSAMTIAYRVWMVRYSLVHACTPDLLLGNTALSTTLGEILGTSSAESLKITAADITTVADLIRTTL